MATRKKYIVYTGNKTNADNAFKAADPKGRWHKVDEDTQEVWYKGFHHFPQKVVNNKSVTIMKLKDYYYETLLKPMIDAGLVECLGCVDGDACDYDDPMSGLSQADWGKIRSVYAKAGTQENITLFGVSKQMTIGFIDVA